ncbi:MAG TPA: NAD(P)-dependent oxidoreductase [Bacteroidales bacterium]|jgi:nucleoside-diphosphate-sugar epimerase|nr:NAD(P)-dependent oxidoreductase [Bacteroidales bacterium]
MKKILITGVTGFLGSHIAEHFVLKNYHIMGLKRSTSSISKCAGFFDKLSWLNIDETEWKQKAVLFKPDFIVHTAWTGVTSNARNDWGTQIQNIDLLYSILQIAEEVKIKKIIGLGSQAEYGCLNAVVDENYPTNPDTAYGAIKLACSELMKTFCESKSIDWYWLRLFSFFGEREDESWLIPSVIKKMMTSSSMDLTPGEQRYAYLYVKDFAKAIENIIEYSSKSGIYNLSSDKAISLKTLLNMIKNIVNPNFELNFGALPYRVNQSMLIEGDITKFNSEICKIDTSRFDEKLMKTIKYYRIKFKNEKS